jgi:hypothetical protein
MTTSGLRRWIWRPRFTLWAMLVLVTVVAIPLGYVAQRRVMNGRRWAEFEALSAKGIEFYLDEHFEPLPSKRAYDRDWLGTLLDEAPQFSFVEIRGPSGRPGPVTTATDRDLRRLLYFTEVEQVTFNGASEVTDAGLRSLMALPNLRGVAVLGMPQITGSFLKGLDGSPLMEGIWLTDLDGLEGEHLEVLVTMPNLWQFTMHSCPKITPESLRRVDMPSGVTHLRLALGWLDAELTVGADIGDDALQRWLSQTKLRMLWLNSPFTRDLAPALSRQTSLETLRINNAPLIDADLVFLGKCEGLSELMLSGLPAEGKFLEEFSDSSELSFLSLWNMPLVEDHLSHLVRFSHLQRLQLNYTPIEGRFLSTPGLPKFYRLDLWGVRFSEEGKENLARRGGLSSVSYPSNWTARDLKRYPNGAIPRNVTLCELHSAEAKSLSMTVDSYYSPWIALDLPDVQLNRIDRCPPDLMASVIRLHDLARAEWKESNRRTEGR